MLLRHVGALDRAEFDGHRQARAAAEPAAAKPARSAEAAAAEAAAAAAAPLLPAAGRRRPPAAPSPSRM